MFIDRNERILTHNIGIHSRVLNSEGDPTRMSDPELTGELLGGPESININEKRKILFG